MTTQTKPWYKSKTFVYAILKSLAGVLLIVASGEAMFDLAGVALLAEGFISGFIRHMTTTAITFSSKK